MLDKQYILENIELVKKNILDRGVSVDVDQFVLLNKQRNELIAILEEMRASRNTASKNKPSEEDILKMRSLGAEIKELEEKQEEIDKSFFDIYSQIPNMSHQDSPIGGEDAALVLETHGTLPKHDFEHSTHEEILLEKNMIDFERGAKVVGSKFYFSKGDLVRLNMAIIQLGMDIASKHGFELIETPDLAKNEILAGIGFNPRGEETQVYSIEGTDLSLVGTAEITMGGYHSDEVLDFTDGPKKYVALSHCYRTEAGAYGKTSKGLYRVHQFTKLEMFVYCEPSESAEIHNQLLEIEKEICDALELSYQVVDIATGDLGAPAFRKYDIEAWMTMKEGYGEVTSASNCTDYQARRLNIKFVDQKGKRQFVHTLNGTAIVTSRMPIAIIEQHQRADKTIYIPKALQPYLNGREFIG